MKRRHRIVVAATSMGVLLVAGAAVAVAGPLSPSGPAAKDSGVAERLSALQTAAGENAAQLAQLHAAIAAEQARRGAQATQPASADASEPARGSDAPHRDDASPTRTSSPAPTATRTEGDEQGFESQRSGGHHSDDD